MSALINPAVKCATHSTSTTQIECLFDSDLGQLLESVQRFPSQTRLVTIDRPRRAGNMVDQEEQED